MGPSKSIGIGYAGPSLQTGSATEETPTEEGEENGPAIPSPP